MNDAPLRIVALGASVTAGTPGFFSPRERPPHGQGNPESQYAYWMMQRHPEWTVLNRGMRGQRTDQILQRFDYDVLDQKPALVIILAGTNDLYQGYEIERPLANLRKMYRRSLEHGIQPAACSLLPLDLADAELKNRILDFNRELQVLAAAESALFCPLYQILENPARPGFLRASPDQVHPDVAGYRLMGATLADLVENFLKTGGLAG